MQSAGNGFKKHNSIPFSKKNPGVVAASLTSRKEKLTSTIPSLKEKNPFHVPSTTALLWQLNNEILQKKKMDTQSTKTSQNTPFASFLSKNFSGRSPDQPPTLQSDIP